MRYTRVFLCEGLFVIYTLQFKDERELCQDPWAESNVQIRGSCPKTPARDPKRLKTTHVLPSYSSNPPAAAIVPTHLKIKHLHQIINAITTPSHVRRIQNCDRRWKYWSCSWGYLWRWIHDGERKSLAMMVLRRLYFTLLSYSVMHCIQYITIFRQQPVNLWFMDKGSLLHDRRQCAEGRRQ